MRRALLLLLLFIIIYLLRHLYASVLRQYIARFHRRLRPYASPLKGLGASD